MFVRRLALAFLCGTTACATHRVRTTPTATEGVVPGIEVLLRDSIHLVRGKRVGLVTNPAGRDRAGTSTIDLLHNAPGVRLTALFALEHGIRGAVEAGGTVTSTIDS